MLRFSSGSVNQKNEERLVRRKGLAWLNHFAALVMLNSHAALGDLHHAPASHDIADTDRLIAHNRQRMGGVPQDAEERRLRVYGLGLARTKGEGIASRFGTEAR